MIIRPSIDGKARADIAAIAQKITNHKNIFVSESEPSIDDLEVGDICLVVEADATGPVVMAHYKASEISAEDGASLSTWADLSGNGNDLTSYGSRPIYRATGVNGRPAVEFVRQDNDGMTRESFTMSSVTGFAYYIVLKFKHLTEDMIPFSIGIESTSDDTARALGLRLSGSSNNIYAHINNEGTAKILPEDVDTDEMLISVRYDGEYHSIYKNNVLMKATAYSTEVQTHDQLSLGRYLNTDGPAPLDGYIAEFLLTELPTLQEFSAQNAAIMLERGIS